uniref:Elongator complex protein 1 n=1 Tax=Steinernema glaseri TaxID=37863 RepID=A0A1I7YEZ4_9BILA
MKNLKLSLVQQCADTPVCSTIAGAQAYCVDPGSSGHYVMLNDVVLSFNNKYEQIHEMNWSAQCPEEKIVAFDLLSDEMILCAVLKSGVVLTGRPGEDDFMIEVAQCIVEPDVYVTAAQWSPDFSTLCIATNTNILFLSRDFDLITQDELNPQRQGSAELMTVGWGSRETQFQGKVGRKAREQPNVDSIPVPVDPTKDDFSASISWHSTGEYVAVNSVDAVEDVQVRVVRIWSREGELISRCVPLAGMESCLATRPVGNLIATARRLNEKRSVCFYEKNGQRRYQFDLPTSRDRNSAGVKIDYLAWNVDASILAAYFVNEAEKLHWVDFYVVSNYKWDLKYVHECSSPLSSVFWDTERAEKFHMLTSTGEILSMSFEAAYDCEDLVAIAVDGCESRVTDLKKGTVPPPMSHSTFSTESEVIEVAGGFGLIAMLLADNSLEICKKSAEGGAGKLVSLSKFSLPKKGLCYNLQLTSEHSVSAIRCGEFYEVLQLDFSSKDLQEKLLFASEVPLVWQNVTQSSGLIIQEADGEWAQIVDGSRQPFILKRSRSGWSRKCTWIDSGKGLIELNHDHELTWNGNVLASNVGSYSVGTNFLLFITLEYQMKAIELSALGSLAPNYIAGITGRPVERGATLLSHEKGGTRVWMQMPRGNLELIHHRSLLIHRLKKLLDDHDYGTATSDMRRQRVDMNLLYDHNPEDFLEHLEDYVNAVNDADFINIFVLNMSNQDCTVTVYGDSYPGRKASKEEVKVKNVCQKLRQIILNIEDVERKHKLFTVALSCFVKESDTLIVSALSELKNLAQAAGDSGLELQKKWLLHMSYMVDAKVLFEHALATYDLGIALLIAENSEWDPKEYLPLLNGFRSYKPAAYMKFQIDLHLQRFDSALKNLSTVEGRFDECVNLIQQHSLYQPSLLIFKEHEKRREIYLLYADYLSLRRSFKEAVLLYAKCDAPEKVLDCYVNLSDHKSFMKLADELNLTQTERLPKLLKMASALEKTARWIDLADVYRCLCSEKYSKNIMEALFKGFQWSTALREFKDVHEKEVLEAVQSRAQMVENSIASWRQNLDQHSSRLKEVISNKKLLFEEWLTGERDVDNDAQSEVFSETSSILSRSSKLSRMSTASSRRRKQIDRKKRSLKPGGQYEDNALLATMKDIYSEIDNQQDEMRQLLTALVECDCLEEATNLQKSLTALIEYATKLSQSVWPSFLSFENLPGPIHELCRGEDGVIRLPPDGFLPQRMAIEPELVRPVIRQNIEWKLDILK